MTEFTDESFKPANVRKPDAPVKVEQMDHGDVEVKPSKPFDVHVPPDMTGTSLSFMSLANEVQKSPQVEDTPEDLEEE